MKNEIMLCTLNLKHIKCDYKTLANDNGDQSIYTCVLYKDDPIDKLMSNKLEPCQFRKTMVLTEATIKDTVKSNKEILAPIQDIWKYLNTHGQVYIHLSEGVEGPDGEEHIKNTVIVT